MSARAGAARAVAAQQTAADATAAGHPRASATLGYALAVATGTAVTLASGRFMGREAALCVLIGLLTLAPLAVRVWTGTFDLFEPAVVIAAVYFVYFVFAPLVRFATDDLTFIGRDFETLYFRALLAVLVAVAAMWCGYALPVGPKPALQGAPRAPVRPAELRAGRRLGWALLVAAVLGMTLWARLAHRSLLTFLLPGLVHVSEEGGGTDIAYLFLSIEWFIPALVLIVAGGGLRRPRHRLAVVLAVTLIYVSIGFRYRIALLWLGVGMLSYLQWGRRPRVLSLALPGVLAFLAAGWLAQARLFFRTGGAVGSLGFDLRGVVAAGLSDTRIFETFAAVLGTVPRFINHSGAAPFTYVLLLPIPRAVWPGKPFPTALTDVAASLGTPEASGAGAFVPHFGEYYQGFGWPGIAVGTFLFGMGAKWLWRWYRAAPDDPWRQAVFVLNNAMIFQVIIRGYTPQLVMEWCFVVLPAVVLIALARRRGRRGDLAIAAPGGAERPATDEAAWPGAPRSVET